MSASPLVLAVDQGTSGTTCLAVFVALIPFMGMLSDRLGRRPQLMVSCIGFALLGYPFFLLGSSGRGGSG